MKGCGHGVFCGSIGPTGKLVGVKALGQEWCDVTPDQLLKTLHHHWGECNWPVIIKTGDMTFLGQGDYSGGFRTEWESELGEALVEDPDEDPSQFVRAVCVQWCCQALQPSSGWWPAVCASPHAPRQWGWSCCGLWGVVASGCAASKQRNLRQPVIQ